MDINIGDKFGYLEIIGLTNSTRKTIHYICKCECGNIIKTGKWDLIGTENRNPRKSCGCKKKRQNGKCAKYLHLYNVWKSLEAKCYNPKHTSYERYGAKGIVVCNEWLNSFDNFLEWSLDNGYSRELTIDRIDSTKGYYPENCRWTTLQIQEINKGLNKNNKTGYKGICINSKNGLYRCDISRGGKRVHLGSYKRLEEAVKIRKLAEEYFLKYNTLDGFKK